jgi:hypothetical protein
LPPLAAHAHSQEVHKKREEVKRESLFAAGRNALAVKIMPSARRSHHLPPPLHVAVGTAVLLHAELVAGAP